MIIRWFYYLLMFNFLKTSKPNCLGYQQEQKNVSLFNVYFFNRVSKFTYGSDSH